MTRILTTMAVLAALYGLMGFGTLAAVSAREPVAPGSGKFIAIFWPSVLVAMTVDRIYYGGCK